MNVAVAAIAAVAASAAEASLPGQMSLSSPLFQMDCSGGIANKLRLEIALKAIFQLVPVTL